MQAAFPWSCLPLSLPFKHHIPTKSFLSCAQMQLYPKQEERRDSGASTGKLHCVALALSHTRLTETPWTVAHQAPPSMGFPRQEYWSGFHSRGSSHPRDWTQDSHTAGAGRFFTSWAKEEAQSLPLLQEIFPTWESDQDLLHWRQGLYQLSYQGKPHLMLAKRPHFLYGDCVFNGIGIARNEGTI